MKKLVLASLAVFIASPILAHAPSNKPIASAPTYSCTKEPVGVTQYTYDIEIDDLILNVYRSSINADWEPLTKRLALSEEFVQAPEGEPLFSCLYTSGKEDGYSVRIEMYNDRAYVFQNSILADFTPIQYNFLDESK